MASQAREPEALVIGSGPAGLGAAAMLERGGVPTLILERASRLAPSWRARYDGFTLNTSSWFSYLPGSRFPRGTDRWPSRDALVAYYEQYADGRGLRIQCDAEVERVDRSESGWRVITSERELPARFVVVATGKYRAPLVPDWPGRDRFGGELLHSSEYRNAGPFRGSTALVVGPGNSGFEIAVQLAQGGARRVQLSVRTPPHLIHRDIGPFPSDLLAVLARRLPVGLVDWASARIRRSRIGDLSEYGLEEPSDGLYSRLRRTGMIPTIDGRFLRALAARQVEVVAAVDRFEDGSVILTDGSRVDADVVVAATGFTRDLEPLVGHLGVLDDAGRPAVHGPRTHSRAPGLHFIGFSEPLSGNLREVRLDGRKIARAIAKARARRT